MDASCDRQREAAKLMEAGMGHYRQHKYSGTTGTLHTIRFGGDAKMAGN
jgi:hypothetical protein